MTDKQKELAAIAEEFFGSSQYLSYYPEADLVKEIWRLRRDLAYQERLSARWYAVATAGACAECGLGSNGEFCACDK